MQLTDSEYQAFKERYPSLHWPDEVFRVPVEVESADGKSTWLEYVSGDQFIDAAHWLERLRRRSKEYDRRKERRERSPIAVSFAVNMPSRKPAMKHP